MHIKKDSASVYQWMAETLHSIDFNPINSLNDSPPPPKKIIPSNNGPYDYQKFEYDPPPKTIIDEKQPPQGS